MIFKNFYKWKEKVSARNLMNNVRDEDLALRKKDEIIIDDFLYICLIPSTYSENLINFSADTLNEAISSQSKQGVTISTLNPNFYPKIEHYFRDYRILRHSQVFTVPTHLKETNNIGEEIRIHPDGRIYLNLKYGQYSLKGKSTFNLDSILERRTHRVILKEKEQQKYGTPIKEIIPKNLEDLLKVVCFPFHPDCKIKMVNLPTRYFTGLFLFPFMIGTRGERRILYQKDTFFEMTREYLGDNIELEYKKSFSYEEITNFLKEMKKFCYGFFRQKSDTEFG